MEDMPAPVIRPGGWITECGYDPYYAGVTDPTVALKLKAKSTARFFCFFLNKGCQKVTIFSTAGGDARLGIVQDNFLAYTQSNTVYPTNDAPYTSPALAVKLSRPRLIPHGSNACWPSPASVLRERWSNFSHVPKSTRCLPLRISAHGLAGGITPSFC